MKEPTALGIVATPHSSPARLAFLRARDYLSAQIIGQEALVEGLLVSLRHSKARTDPGENWGRCTD